MNTPQDRPALGIQGPVVAMHDPWAGAGSDAIMRTGTGVTIASQDPPMSPGGFVAALRRLGADFYVHHVIPTEPTGDRMLRDLDDAGIDVVLGNEFGNINGPYVEGTNRYDLPTAEIEAAVGCGRLAGVLYDEPEHLQLHASQYRKDAFLPHFGDTAGLSADESIDLIDTTIRGIVGDVAHAVDHGSAGRASGGRVPVLAEQVFPVLFHTFARGGMTPTPKVMKESFQSLQLATALGASLQYGRDLWICADLWGPDIGPWITRAPGFPGHSPAEFASALRMAYLFAPSAMFVENLDVLLRHAGDDAIVLTEYGEVWQQFVRDYVPATPLRWSFDEATADVVIIHAEDSDFGRGRDPFGNRSATAPATSRSVFEAWHVISHGTIPAHGSSLHIAGYEFPRALLDDVPRAQFPLPRGAAQQTRVHGLFHASRNVLVFDEHVTDARLGAPELLFVVGSRLPRRTLALVRSRAEAGATVVIAEWLTAEPWSSSQTFGAGQWIVVDRVDSDEVIAAVQPFLGRADEWTQRFGDTEIRITPADGWGETLTFEISSLAKRFSA